MPLSLQFPSAKVGLPVAFGPLDGSEVIGMASVTNVSVSADGNWFFNYVPAQDLFIDNTGLVRFGFRSSHEPGAYRVVVQLPGEQHILQFYVTDPAHALSQPPWRH